METQIDATIWGRRGGSSGHNKANKFEELYSMVGNMNYIVALSGQNYEMYLQSNLR